MKYPKDYDKDRSEEGEYWQKNVSEYVEQSSGQIRWDRINNATSNWDPETQGLLQNMLRELLLMLNLEK